ncbi:hypothetical protein M3Y94_00011200 [Aphelenchoides besseyi]|nr:hypothetical protein M3Y94_00011200 [Aphelenchoides besseyi]KAI6220710.1 hypothetical protein M3Y95_01025000 [Aphelenchoides besseyi]
MKTPDYDPQANSSIIRYLLRGLDGGYQRTSRPYSDAEESTIITLGQFPLWSESARVKIGISSTLFGLLGIGAVVLGVMSLITLAIVIPVSVISILFSALMAAAFFNHHIAQHRYVLVQFDDDHTVLYDAITKMKRRRFGRYTRSTCKSLKVSTTRRSYEFIEAAFEEMPKRLGPPIPGAYDCQDWADEFYAKIC